MRLAVVALVAALSAASASQTWLRAAGYPEPTETVLEKSSGKNVTRKFNPVCSDGGEWKNKDAAKKEKAVKEYREAERQFKKETDAAEERRAALLKERNELESKAVTLRLSLTSLDAAFSTEDEKARALLGERNAAAKKAREASATTKATSAAIRSLNRTIETLEDSISGLKAEEDRTEGRVTAATGKLLGTIRKFGKAETKAKAEGVELREQIDGRQGDVDTVSSRLDALSRAVADVAAQRNATLKRVAEIRARRAELTAQRRALGKEVAQLEADIARHTSELDRANELKHKAEADAARAQSDELDASQKASSAERKVGMMEEEKAALEHRLAADRATMADSVAAVQALADRRKSIQTRLQALANASATLRVKEEALVGAHEAIRGNASAVAERLAAVRGRLSAATIDAVRAERVAAAHRSRRDAEAALGRTAGEAVDEFRHRADMRRAQFVKDSAQGLLGSCDCAADASGCDKCGPDGGGDAEDEAEEPPAATDVLQSADPLPDSPDGDEQAEFASDAGLATSFALGATDALRSDEDVKDADAITKASAMVADTASALERARGAVVTAAAAQGAVAGPETGAPDTAGGDLGKPPAGEMSTTDAVELASSTEAKAQGARTAAEDAIDSAEGAAAAKEELDAATVAAAATPEDAAAEEATDAAVADLGASADAASADADAAAERVDDAPEPMDQLAAAAGDDARFRQRGRLTRRSLRGQAVLSASASGSNSTSGASSSSSNETSSDGAQEEEDTSPADPFAGLEWSRRCRAYSSASDRHNKAAAALSAVTHVVKVAKAKHDRTTAQLKAALRQRDASRAAVDALAERVSEQQEAVRAARRRAARLREDLEGIQASIKEAVAGLDDSQARAQAMQDTKDDLALAERAERRALDRVTAQESRVDAVLERESSKLEAERLAAQKRTETLRGVLASMDEDVAAKQKRVDDLLAEQRRAGDALAAAEKAEAEARTGADGDSKDVDEAAATRDHEAAREATVEAEIKQARDAEARSAEAADAAKGNVRSAEATLAGMKAEARRLRGSLEQAKAAEQGTSTTHAIAEADGFALEIAVRKLQDRLQSKEADVDGLRHRLSDLARETQAFHHSVDTADDAIATLEGQEEATRRRVAEARKLADKEAAAAAAAESDKLAQEAALNAYAKKRGMAPPGTMQQLEESQARRSAIEAAVGGARADEAAKLVSEPFAAPPLPAQEPDAASEAAALAAVDPEVDAVLAEEAKPAPAKADEADEADEGQDEAGDAGEDEDEEDVPPPAPIAEASAKSAEEDAAAIEKAEEDSVVSPDDLPGATGDPETDSVTDPTVQPEAEAVEEIKPAPAAGGPANQEVQSPDTPGGAGGDDAGGDATGGMGLGAMGGDEE